MLEAYRDIDEAAECDIRLFWRLVKAQKPRAFRIYPEICEAGVNYDTPDREAEAFASFFENLYSPLTDDDFDDKFKENIEEQYAHLKSDHINNDIYLPGGPITNDDVKNVIKQLKRRKAPGDDGITNEHIIFG
ncbi:hypothetical protein FSP39_019895 [Pinctada imbricata]|uniref:Uncharacterized protein n=1 Tax=Pinctada imbricata TaxID=66713 RepID=A0AA89C0L0_PINIB|nr:hypothetical protein FSP39_019895 [Pinctada imbricata]